MQYLRKLVTVAILFLGFAGHSFAISGWLDYSPEAFADAQAQGNTILVDVSADWCPTCRAQKPILDELTTDERLQDVVFMRADFDTQKAFLQAHRVPRQSTILIFEGESEIDRSIAETNRDRLRTFVFEAVGAEAGE